MRVDFPRATPACSKNGAGGGPAASRTFWAVIKSDLIDDGEVGLVTELKSSFSAKFMPREESLEMKISINAPTTTPVNGTPIFQT
jgi:hypothetical protein